MVCKFLWHDQCSSAAHAFGSRFCVCVCVRISRLRSSGLLHWNTFIGLFANYQFSVAESSAKCVVWVVCQFFNKGSLWKIGILPGEVARIRPSYVSYRHQTQLEQPNFWASSVCGTECGNCRTVCGRFVDNFKTWACGVSLDFKSAFLWSKFAIM